MPVFGHGCLIIIGVARAFLPPCVRAAHLTTSPHLTNPVSQRRTYDSTFVANDQVRCFLRPLPLVCVTARGVRRSCVG
jgi:hypothetical protein